jgi:hypothetical protein
MVAEILREAEVWWGRWAQHSSRRFFRSLYSTVQHSDGEIATRQFGLWLSFHVRLLRYHILRYRLIRDDDLGQSCA